MFYISKKNRNLHAVFEAGCTFASVIDSLIGTDRIFGTMMTSIVAFVYVRNKRACLPVASVEFVTFASIVFMQISAGCIRITWVGITLVGSIYSRPGAACNISKDFPRCVEWGANFGR